MNLFLRLIRIVIQAFYRKKINFFDEGEVSFHVWPLDMDLNNHMTNSRYLSVMDLGRTDLLIRSGLVKDVRKHKWATVLGAVTIRWRRGLNLFQKYTLKTKVIGWDEKWFYLDQKIYAKDQVIAHAMVKAIFVSKQGSVPAEKVIECLGVKDVKSPTLPEAVIHWKAAEDCMRQETQNIIK